jgi:creatinine amidohydrolase
MPVYPLAATTWTTLQTLSTDQLVAILPLGAVEAHGPHLPLGTDIIIAEAMANAGADLLSMRGLDVLVLPVVPVAPAPFAKAFAGTIDTPAAATTALIIGIARSLHLHGVRLTAVANAHHDPANVMAIRAAVDQVAAAGGTLVFPDLTRRRWASRLTEEFQTGACHAGRFEGSVVLARALEWVDVACMRALPPNPNSLSDAIRRGDRSFEQAGGVHAYFGWPADATPEEGERIIATLATILEEAVLEALDARPRAGSRS